MPCCGGDKGGKPISRRRWLAGRAGFSLFRRGLSGGLHGAGLLSPRLARVAAFWDLLSSDWAEQIARREGIVLEGEADAAEACPLEPPSHATVGEGLPFDADWDAAFVEDADEDASRRVA